MGFCPLVIVTVLYWIHDRTKAYKYWILVVYEVTEFKCGMVNRNNGFVPLCLPLYYLQLCFINSCSSF